MNISNIHQSIQRDHPRLFISKANWPAIEHNLQKEDRDLFKNIKADTDTMIKEEIEVSDHGIDAAKAAFIYQVTDEEKYSKLAYKLLSQSVKYYHVCYRANESVDWHSYSRIHAWMAYDWIYNSLQKSDRTEIALSFLEAVKQVQPTEKREQFHGENWSDHQSGFYGTQSLLWYAGLATYNDGVNDDLSQQFLTRGYELYTDLLEYRSSLAGDVGGSASATIAYAFGDYPWAEFNFFHTLRSATGLDISGNWPYVALLPGYLFWNWLPGRREFGTGDAHHKLNKIRYPEWIHTHCSNIIHFYGENEPRKAAFAKWLRERLPREFHYDDLRWPLSRLFITNRYPDLEPEGPPTDLGTARHFPGMGQVFFRSGYGSSDTYASFTTGGDVTSHKHYDHGHFNIYKQGFLALDAGARAYPANHLTHYYSRTIAHNSLLIEMPSEKMPDDYWGGSVPAPEEDPAPVPNDGGQRKQIGSETVAFESHPQYAYAACDMTDVYHEQKCDLALRQFVYLPPNRFVIFDRVCAKDPTYAKTWLLHTAAEPCLTGSKFITKHKDGQLLGQTMYPPNASMTATGGSGRQFTAGEQNWPLGDDFAWPETNPLYGQWRIEVTPTQAACHDQFLHVLQAADQSCEKLPNITLVDDGEYLGVQIQDKSDCSEVVFDVEGDPAGYINRSTEDHTIVDRSFAQSVELQEGLSN